jgi:hypothetical protein
MVLRGREATHAAETGTLFPLPIDDLKAELVDALCSEVTASNTVHEEPR